MLAVTTDRARTRAEFWPVLCFALLALVLFQTGATAQAVPAANGQPAESDGLFITVHNPITTTVVNQVKAKAGRFLQRPDRRGLKVVFDFNPDGHSSGTSDYGPCHDLAAFIMDLHDVTTVAFVHNEVSRFTVLPVLACKDVAMSAEARLGEALRDQVKPLDEDQRLFFRLVADRHGRAPALVLKTADKDLPVLEGTRAGGVWYVDQRQLAEEVKRGFVQTAPQPVLEAGAAALYTTLQAQKFGLCHLKKETRQELAEAYRLPPRSLSEDPLEGRTPVASRIVVGGPVNAALAETLQRRIRRAIAHRGVNFVLLQLECGGGDAIVARDLADFLRGLKDDRGRGPVMTVAYVTEEARDTAAFLALGCTEVVMSSRARLGDFERYLRQRPQFRDPILRSLQELAREQGYPPLLARGWLDPDVAIHRVRSQKGQLERRLIEGAELAADKRGEQKWVDEGQVKAPGQPFLLDAALAHDLGVARHVVEGTPAEALPKVYAHYGLENVRDARMDWLDELAQFLRLPVVSVFLVLVGITGLILEMKIPGVGFPAVVAAVCFVLFFWAHSQLAGHLTMLAVLLFCLGLILIGLEIFVVPGFGVTGISGIALVVVSLGLATLVKKPETTQEWVDFGATLSGFGGALVGAVVAAFVLAWYLPSIPYVNRLVLAPAQAGEVTEEELSDPQRALALKLLGAIGEAATTLRPAGMARFGDEYVDVVAEGSYVQPGSRVQVIEIEGNRIVVKQV